MVVSAKTVEKGPRFITGGVGSNDAPGIHRGVPVLLSDVRRLGTAQDLQTRLPIFIVSVPSPTSARDRASMPFVSSGARVLAYLKADLRHGP